MKPEITRPAGIQLLYDMLRKDEADAIAVCRTIQLQKKNMQSGIESEHTDALNHALVRIAHVRVKQETNRLAHSAEKMKTGQAVMVACAIARISLHHAFNHVKPEEHSDRTIALKSLEWLEERRSFTMSERMKQIRDKVSAHYDIDDQNGATLHRIRRELLHYQQLLNLMLKPTLVRQN